MRDSTPLKIVICINYLAVGGSQSFALALARGLAAIDTKIFVYDFSLPYKTRSLKDLDSPLLKGNSFIYSSFQSSFWLLFERIFSFSKFTASVATYWVNIFRVRAFRKFVLKNKIHVVSSHLMAADTLSALAVQDLNVVHVATMHGSYEGFPSSISNPIRNKVFSRVNGIVYLTDRNIQFLNQLKINTSKIRKRKIYNGYIPAVFKAENITRESLGISKNDFVFIQVARGTEDKGWRETCEAFSLLIDKFPHSKLVLVGAGEALDKLKDKYKGNNAFIFYGYSGNPLPLIKISDVGLLPSYYKGESLPNTIIEYLDYSIPVIASSIGEISIMIGANEENEAGIVLNNSPEGPVSIQELFEAMLCLIKDKDFYNRLKSNTSLHFEKFKMENCVKAYRDFFQELLEKV